MYKIKKTKMKTYFSISFTIQLQANLCILGSIWRFNLKLFQKYIFGLHLLGHVFERVSSKEMETGMCTLSHQLATNEC